MNSCKMQGSSRIADERCSDAVGTCSRACKRAVFESNAMRCMLKSGGDAIAELGWCANALTAHKSR